MLCLLSPFLGIHKRSCVLRGSRTHCASRRPSGERAALGRAVRCGVRWHSDFGPIWSHGWISEKQSVSCKQKPSSMAPFCFYRSFLFVSLTPKPSYATEMPWAIQPLSRVISQGAWSLENTRWKAGDPSSGPRQSISSPHAKIVGLWETTFCGYTVLNDTKTLLHGHRLAELLTLFSWGCNLQKKQQQKNSAIFNNLYSF